MTFDHHKMDKVRSENERNHVEFRLPMGSKITKIGMHVVRHKRSIEDIFFTNPHRLVSLETLQRQRLSLHHSPPVNSWDRPPAENSLRDYLPSSIAQIGISSATTNVQATQPVKITDFSPDRQDKNWSDNSSANTSTQKQLVSPSQKPSQSKENPEQEIPSEVIQEQSKEETSVQSPLEDADVFAIDDNDDAEDGLTPEIPLKRLYELLNVLNEPVDSLAENDDMRQKLLNLCLDLNGKSLPPAVIPVIHQPLLNFIYGVFDTFLEVKRIEMDIETFAASLCSLEKDLEKAQKSKNNIEAGLCKGKSGQLELEAQISDLMSKKKWVDSGIAKGEAELAKINKKIASLTQYVEEKTIALSQASVQLERANTSKKKLLEDQNKLELSI